MGASSKRATCTGYCSCCTVLLLFCSLLHYKSVLSEYLGGPTFEWDGLFLRERVLENMPSPCFE